MSFLNHSELKQLIKETNCVQGKTINEDVNKPYSRDSSIQSCSVDLHVGEMYIPGTADTSLGGKANPNTDEVIVKPGASLLVRTEELLQLPKYIGGVCYAPARDSLKGLLIVNIGHIDPGFEGRLHYTVINLGKENITIRKSQLISTLLLFKLSGETESFGKEETVSLNGNNIPKTVNDSLPRLASTFMDFENKTRDMINAEITKANFKIPIIIAVLTIAATFLTSLILDYLKNADELQKKIEQIDSRITTIEKEKSVDERLDKIEDNLNKNSK
ncbi:hypothetical protein FE783_13655 [Paenibacillus mesophilus]|uniref:dCTP deaminase domain-containing protein n=1 Tax=Paenibacillus mesophilus TaxID=2582849 RepID=UPI00110D7ACD|nr:hypothetical protein [Paenibacillus mesophilus]TMV49544.1 hypothetical protein FE783_13655 [Paenibacillus mesophilus]